MPGKPCKDCGSTTRPTPHPGPRCATCNRARKKVVSAQRHDAYAQRQYGLAAGQYEAIKAAQGGRCAICQRGQGITRRLAIDHDHSCCPGAVSCGRCVRGLLCGRCNDMLAHARDDHEVFLRAVGYLNDPPAHTVTVTTEEDA